MTELQASTITEAMIFWAAQQPDRDEPFMLFDQSSVSPRELAKAVQERTPLGIKQLEVFDFAMKSGAESFDTILAGLGWRDSGGSEPPKSVVFPPKGPGPGEKKKPNWLENDPFLIDKKGTSNKGRYIS
jgi:hypothetical protein